MCGLYRGKVVAARDLDRHIVLVAPLGEVEVPATEEEMEEGRSREQRERERGKEREGLSAANPQRLTARPPHMRARCALSPLQSRAQHCPPPKRRTPTQHGGCLLLPLPHATDLGTVECAASGWPVAAAPLPQVHSWPLSRRPPDVTSSTTAVCAAPQLTDDTWGRVWVCLPS